MRLTSLILTLAVLAGVLIGCSERRSNTPPAKDNVEKALQQNNIEHINVDENRECLMSLDNPLGVPVSVRSLAVASRDRAPLVVGQRSSSRGDFLQRLLRQGSGEHLGITREAVIAAIALNWL